MEAMQKKAKKEWAKPKLTNLKVERTITILGAIEISAPINISHFGCTNIIFVGCIVYVWPFKPQEAQMFHLEEFVQKS